MKSYYSIFILEETSKTWMYKKVTIASQAMKEQPLSNKIFLWDYLWKFKCSMSNATCLA